MKASLFSVIGHLVALLLPPPMSNYGGNTFSTIERTCISSAALSASTNITKA